MVYNKFVYEDANKIDLTGDTVTEDALLEGYTAHNRSGEKIEGKAKAAPGVINSKFEDGAVKKGQNQISKVWKTNENGEPDWRDENTDIVVGNHNMNPESHPYLLRSLNDVNLHLNRLDQKDISTDDQISQIKTSIEKVNQTVQNNANSNNDSLQQLGADKISYSDIVNDLNTPTSTKPLSAAQGFQLNVAINQLIDRLNTIANSDDVSLDQLAEIVAYIKNNKSLIDQITTNKISYSDIVDNLASSRTDKPLSANQGRVLDNKINATKTELQQTIQTTKESLQSNIDANTRNLDTLSSTVASNKADADTRINALSSALDTAKTELSQTISERSTKGQVVLKNVYVDGNWGGTGLGGNAAYSKAIPVSGVDGNWTAEIFFPSNAILTEKLASFCEVVAGQVYIYAKEPIVMTIPLIVCKLY